MFLGRALFNNTKRKRNDPEDMPAFFSQVAAKAQQLQPPPAPSRKPSQRLARPDADLDEFLSSDLEVSFASTMSLNSAPNSPEKDAFLLDLHAENNAPFSPNAMDISPAPKPLSKKRSLMFGRSNKETAATTVTARPRAFTVTRAFGRELSNHQQSPVSTFAVPAPEPVKGDGPGIPRSRSPLPVGWMGVFSKQPKPSTPPPELEPEFHHASDAMDMDIDDCILPPELTQPLQHSVEDQTVKLSAIPAPDSYSKFFFDELSPERPAVPMRPRKRRSLSPPGSPRQVLEEPQGRAKNTELLRPAFDDLMSSPAPPSPSAQKLDRFASTGGGLFGRKSKPAPLMGLYANESASGAGSKRGRRPTFSALSRQEPHGNGGHALSAFPILDSSSSSKESGSSVSGPTFAQPPARRAFSGSVATMMHPPSPGVETENEGNESDAGPEFSSPAAQAYAKRQNVRTVRRRDGTDDFRPLTGVGMQQQQQRTGASPMPLFASPLPAHSPLRKTATMAVVNESPSSRWLHGAGLPGFGDNEAHGKVLPCERVPEDGLMRINVHTLDSLIAGKFDDKIASYQVIDCRFDYEYQGGHIKGAVNINTTEEIEEYLLGKAVHKPSPSCSGDTIKKTVLVFHCEFSAKRAPTFAKHLRSKDRSMNNHVYPRIHYPEVYILKGGYSQYYAQSAMFSEPRGYVRMDDPMYARDRRADLDMFRTKSRFARTRSYAFGESGKNASSGAGAGANSGSSNGNGLSMGMGKGMGMGLGMARTKSQAVGAHQRNAASCGSAAMFSGAPVFSSAAPQKPTMLGHGLGTLDEDANNSSMMSDGDGDGFDSSFNFSMDNGDGDVVGGVDKSPCPPPTMRSGGAFGMLGGNSGMLGGARRMQRAMTYAAIR